MSNEIEAPRPPASPVAAARDLAVKAAGGYVEGLGDRTIQKVVDRVLTFAGGAAVTALLAVLKAHWPVAVSGGVVALFVLHFGWNAVRALRGYSAIGRKVIIDAVALQERVSGAFGKDMIREREIGNLDSRATKLEGRYTNLDAVVKELQQLPDVIRGETKHRVSIQADVATLKSWAGNVIFGQHFDDGFVHEPMGRDHMIAASQGRTPVTIILPDWAMWAHGRFGLLEAVLLSLSVDPRTFRPNGDRVELTDLSNLLPENQDKIKTRYYKARTVFGDQDVTFADFVFWAENEKLPVPPNGRLVATVLRGAPKQPR